MNDSAYELRQKLIRMERPVRTWHWLMTSVVVILVTAIFTLQFWTR